MELIKYISGGKEVYDFFKDGVIVINPNFTILYANKVLMNSWIIMQMNCH